MSCRDRKKKIMLLCATRHNPFRKISVLFDEKRVNFSMSRARNLNIIIPDQGMLSKIPTLKSIYDAGAPADCVT